MIFRQLFDQETGTYTYLLADAQTRQALLIDPVKEQAERDLRLLKELQLELTVLLETHVHADHITAIQVLKQAFPQAQVMLSQAAGAQGADRYLSHGDIIQLGNLELIALATPGHTNGCMSYRLPDRVFTGDTLLIRGCGRTDFQEGNAQQLYRSVMQHLFSLPDQTLVYPGHNYQGITVSSIAEEKRWNPRLADKTEAEFVALMQQLNLPEPKKIAVAVPANLKCGQMTTENL